MRMLLTILLFPVFCFGQMAGVTSIYNPAQERIKAILSQPRDINPIIFGAVGDGIADDTKPIQMAIDSAIKTKSIVYLPDNYKITRPLVACLFDGTQYKQIYFRMQGRGSMWNNGTVSTITATFTDAPVFSIQQGKGCVISGIMFQSVSQGRDSRYSPQASICVDPFSATLPPDSGYPSLREYYRGLVVRSGSTATRFEDCATHNTTVGIVISPNGYTQNAESLTFEHIRFGTHKYGFAGCQAQEKANQIRDIAAWSPMECLFQFNTYGAQQPGNYFVDGVNIAGGVKAIINRTSAGWGPMFINNLFAENINTIGYWQSWTGDAITNFLINFTFNNLPSGTLPIAHISGGGVTLSKGEIRYYGTTYPTVFFGNKKNEKGWFTLDNVRFTDAQGVAPTIVQSYTYCLPDGIAEADCSRGVVTGRKLANPLKKQYAFFLDNSNTYLGYAHLSGDSITLKSPTIKDGNYKVFFK